MLQTAPIHLKGLECLKRISDHCRCDDRRCSDSLTPQRDTLSSSGRFLPQGDLRFLNDNSPEDMHTFELKKTQVPPSAYLHFSVTHSEQSSSEWHRGGTPGCLRAASVAFSGHRGRTHSHSDLSKYALQAEGMSVFETALKGRPLRLPAPHLGETLGMGRGSATNCAHTP